MANSVLAWLFSGKRYRAEWVDDLPDPPRADTLYVVGGRQHPFRVVMACPNAGCEHLVHLDVHPDAEPGWELQEHRDGSLTLWPSVHVTGLPCRSHYWVRKGRVRWTAPEWLGRIQRVWRAPAQRRRGGWRR